MIVKIAITAAVIIITLSYKRNNIKLDDSRINKDLDAYYELPGDKYKQLLQAAKSCLQTYWEINEQLEIAEKIHKRGIISDEFVNILKQKEDEIAIEKMMIQKEAELLSKGLENTIFKEAAKGPFERKEKKAPMMDEKMFYKKKELLQKCLLEKYNIK